MSRTTSEALVTCTEISPLVPAGTIAALATSSPVGEFSVETRGRVPPVGHVVRYCKSPWGTAVTFSEYACAVEGMPQLLDCTGKARLVPALNVGPPRGPVALRVSATRHWVSG